MKKYKTIEDLFLNNVHVPAGTEVKLSDRAAKYLQHALKDLSTAPELGIGPTGPVAAEHDDKAHRSKSKGH
jgi:hypothetical protein